MDTDSLICVIVWDENWIDGPCRGGFALDEHLLAIRTKILVSRELDGVAKLGVNQLPLLVGSVLVLYQGGQNNTNLGRSVRNDHAVMTVDSQKLCTVGKWLDRIFPSAHDIVLREIIGCKIEEGQFVVACLFEDFSPVCPLLRGGGPDVVLDEGL